MGNSRPAIGTFVLINGEQREDVALLSIHRTLGGGRLDTCEFTIRDESLLNQIALQNGTDFTIEAGIKVSANNAFAGGPQVLHWGRIAANSITTEGRTVYTSRTEHFHFGVPLRGMWEFNPTPDTKEKTLINDAPLVFNPEIDGIVKPNRRPRHDGLTGVPCSLFVDPESLRTNASQEYQQVDGGTAGKWNLQYAVQYLCTVLNIAEANIANPTVANLALLDPSNDLLQNFRIPNGLYLPQALDYLLSPFGYTWFVNYEKVGLRRIVVLKRGAGEETTLLLQKPGAALDRTASNTERFTVDYNVAGATNKIITLGDFRFLEGSFQLTPAWDSSLDNTNPSQLSKDAPEYRDNPKLQRVWREWVLNEAGDYIGTRKSITGPAPLDQFFGHAVVPRRRRFFPTLVLGDDGVPLGEVHGVNIRWARKTGFDAGIFHELAELQDHTVHLLERECGIRFDGLFPPEELMVAGADNVVIVITATLRDDQRLSYTGTNLGDSPLGEPHTLLLDASNRFCYRQQNANSNFLKLVKTKVRKAALVDDTQPIREFTEKLLGSWNMADVSASVTVEGLDGRQYSPGQVVTKIEGREISLSGVSPQAVQQRYPQIVGIVYDFQKQKRKINLQTMREEHLARALR